LKADYLDSRPAGDHDADAVVTYTRVPAKRRLRRQPMETASQRNADRGPILDASEIRPEGPIAFDHPAGEPHSDRGPNGWRRYSLVGGSVAVVAGVGILAVTFGVTTVLPGADEASRGSVVPALALASADSSDADVSAADTVREISMTAEMSDEPAPLEAVAPIPRPRPDGHVASVSAEPTSVTPVPKTDVSRAEVEAAAASAEPAAVPVLAPPESAGTDSLITSIEETLARIDESAPAEDPTPLAPPVQPQQTEAPILAPPDVASPPIDVVPTPAPPAVAMPPADIVPPSATGGIEPVYDVLPPPVGIEGIGSYSTGPVPPEPVPQAYPQAPHLDPAAPWPYPTEAYIYPQDGDGSAEGRRPGILRRTLAKASDAVGRVLDRN